MNSGRGFFSQWPSGQPQNGPPFLPARGTFSDVPQSRPQVPFAEQQHATHVPNGQYVHPQQMYQQTQSAFTPLIPMSAVEDLQLPQVPFHSGEPMSGVPFATSGPVVHEGYIPAPGRNDEDTYPDMPPGYDDHFDTSEEESDYDRHLTFEEHMRQLEEHDNSEVDKDYSEEEAQEDAGDPSEMELEGEFEDEEDRTIRKRGKSSAKGTALEVARGGVGVVRGNKRGRARGSGRGGQSGSAMTRKKSKGRGRGRPKTSRKGPRAQAEPGPEFNALQRQANEKYIAQDFPAALELAQKAIQLNPEIFDAHNIASECWRGMGEEIKSIDSLIIGAPTKREASQWQYIIERVNNIDEAKYPEYTEEAKTALTLRCLLQIVHLETNNYEARSHILQIEAGLGHSSKCVKLGRKMLKIRKENKEAPDTEVLKIIAMMGTTSKRQTKIHLKRLLESFDESIDFFLKKKPDQSDLDWEMINIYLDLLERKGDYEHALRRLKALARWKQGRVKEKYWDDQDDDREYDLEDEPRRAAVPHFRRKIKDAKYGQTLPLEIRVKLGIFRLRKSPGDFQEAMHHLDMLEPDDHSSEALVWDYEDLFRVIGDALHANGHDREAMRFYEPLYKNNSPELGLMSYLGIFTCYKSLGQPEKADEMIPMLKEWNPETVDDLVKLAVFFENQGMMAEAIQRAEILYRNKYAHRLRRLGFKAYDNMRDENAARRKQATGKHSARKSTVKKQRKLTKKATGRKDGVDDDTGNDGNDGELPSLGPLEERPNQGLFRTRRIAAKPAKAQTFLPLQGGTESEPAPAARPNTFEGTDVPLRAISHKFFRSKLDSLAKNYADELQAARAQHRETVASFKRLAEISGAAEDGDEDAMNEVLSITRELIEEFSTFDLFYSNRKEEFVSYFRRTGDSELWRESALMVLAVCANDVEDGAIDPDIKERPDQPPSDFWGVDIDKWIDAFGRYAVILAREGDEERCFSTLDITIQSNIVFRSKNYFLKIQLCRLACALAVDNSNQASSAVRWLMKEHPFGSDLFRLYSCVNRMCSFPEEYYSGPSHKVLMRYIKTMDYALLTEEERVWYNFRDRTDSAGGFRNSINSEDVKFVKDHDPALFALYAHVLMCGGSYMAALNYYFRAFAMTPDDAILNLSIGIAYIQHAMKRLSENRQYQIQQGLAFVNRYYELRVKENVAIQVQEAEFNVARIWHALGLVSLALPAYERCINMSKRVQKEAEDRCIDGDWVHEDFKYEAAFAVQSIYAVSGNVEAAKAVTKRVLVLD